MKLFCWISTLLSMFALLFFATGCANLFNQHAQMMDAMRGVMADTAGRLSTTGTGQIQAGGHVINPGIRVTGGMEYYATARYEGLAGQVQASMAGNLDREVPADVREASLKIWRNTSWTDEQKRALILDLLERSGLLDKYNEVIKPPTTQTSDVPGTPVPPESPKPPA